MRRYHDATPGLPATTSTAECENWILASRHAFPSRTHHDRRGARSQHRREVLIECVPSTAAMAALASLRLRAV